MEQVSVRIEKMIIPTYEIGNPEKNPVFLENRVYQGSTGKVYPYPVVEHISDTKTEKEYEAVLLENEYLIVTILPSLGGRIQRAYDKTNGYDFVYYNQVIKPALVGLTGPWISGGIEFNWPQHHRPTTFLPVDYEIVEENNGKKGVWLHDVDQINGTKNVTKISLSPGKAYIEIEGQLYNRTEQAQTFLWWANPAVAVNDHTQSVFPPDVHAVMDHGKRDVSKFPIATGTYYKMDYSEGVDISRYKNIPVPTSYMAEKSNYDFVGGYDYQKEAGILHIADHHISPGKKQWTWGCGDFGKAWDRNLTDEDGPYIELMTGVYTDNQPDFTWLKPFEEKTFTQYFMPYKKLGQVKNATLDAALNLTVENGVGKVAVYATGEYENVRITVEADHKRYFEAEAKLSPNDIFESEFSCPDILADQLTVRVQHGVKCLVSYSPEKEGIATLPDPATAAKQPEEIMTNEELFLTGQHIEQYRHATYLPDPYYLEGLKRDPEDVRINNAYGALLLRRLDYENARLHFQTAIKRLTKRNPNPYDSEAYYNLGLALCRLDLKEEAYDAFYKASWSNEQQEMSFYFLSVIQAEKENYEAALYFADKSLVKNAHNIKARGVKAYLLRKLGKFEEAKEQVTQNLLLDPFDFISAFEALLLVPAAEKGDMTEKIQLLMAKMRNFEHNFLLCARDYGQMGAYKEALDVLKMYQGTYPMISYYMAYCEEKTGHHENAADLLNYAESLSPDYCFPNNADDHAILSYAISQGAVTKAPYYLGNLYYDKRQYEKAIEFWEMSSKNDDTFPTVHRNLSIAYYNKQHDSKKALLELEKAFSLDNKDARVLLELDQLWKKCGRSENERFHFMEQHLPLVFQRDDLLIEYITLLSMSGRYKEAYDTIMNHHFHPWEGGEGKVTTQYKAALLGLAKEALQKQAFYEAQKLLETALFYPENLGEGKLDGEKDNDIRFYLGLALEYQNKQHEAEHQYKLAELGTDEPAGMMYYNDQPADMIYYQGLAFQKEKNTKKANARFYRLIDFGERHLTDEVKIEYFAVSLPDLSVFEDNYTIRNKAHCNYLMGLGNLGLGNFTKANEFFETALSYEPSHRLAQYYQQSIEK